jgi:hypothetical protein
VSALLTLAELSFTVREVFSSFGPHAMSPSDAAWQQLISTLHGSGRKAALAITGGGSGAIGELLRVPGGSRLLIEAQVPYDEQALAAFLGFAPAQACSTDTAIAMARTARARAARLVPSASSLSDWRLRRGAGINLAGVRRWTRRPVSLGVASDGIVPQAGPFVFGGVRA